MSGQLVSYLALLVSHWIADFVMQTHWQATNKSKNNIALSHHVLVYTACLAAISALLFGSRSALAAFCGWKRSPSLRDRLLHEPCEVAALRHTGLGQAFHCRSFRSGDP